MDSVFLYWNPRMDNGSNESILREDFVYKAEFAFLKLMMCLSLGKQSKIGIWLTWLSIGVASVRGSFTFLNSHCVPGSRMPFEIITSVVYGDHCLNAISSSFCLLLSFEPQQLTSRHSHHSKASLWRIRRHICYQCIVLYRYVLYLFLLPITKSKYLSYSIISSLSLLLTA